MGSDNIRGFIVDTIFIGIILGAVLIGFIAMITIIVRVAFIVTEMATIVKSVYIATNKIEQMTQATMDASEHFVDALNEVSQPQLPPPPQPRATLQVYKSIDPIKNFREFLDTVRKDTGLSEDDVSDLRKLFEDNSKFEDTLNDDDADENEPKEPWKE